MGFFLHYFGAGNFTIRCSSNGREPESVDQGVKKVEKLLEEKRRAELSARIASGEFTVEQSGYVQLPQILFFWGLV